MQHTFGEFFGQMSEDDMLVREGQVMYSENLDLTSNTDYVTLSPKPTSLLTTSDEIQAIYFLERGIEKPVFGDDNKKIYVDSQEKYTANNDVRMFWSNSEFLYWLDYAENIFRIPLDDVEGTWTGNVEACETNLENDNGKGFVVEGEGSAWICYGTKLYEIDNSTGLLMDQYNFLFEQVVGMIDSRDVIEIVQKNGIVFSWDRVSETAQSYDLGIRVAIVVQSANERYLIGEGAVYLMSGGAKNKIAGQYNSDEMQTNKFKFRELENSNVGFLKDVVYLGSDDIDSIKPDDDFVEFGHTSVLMLGNKKSGMPQGISKFINTSSDGSKYTHIYGMTTKATAYSGYNDSLYITYKNENDVYGVDVVDLDKQNYTTSQEGILILPKFNGGSKRAEKRLNRIGIRAEWNDNGSFYIYKVEGNKLVPFKGDREQSKVVHTDGFLEKWLDVKENFHHITLAVVFKQDNDRQKNDALKLYAVTLDYEPIGR